VDFKDGTRITYQCPPCKISGLLFGKRIIQFYGDVKYEDPKNNLVAEFHFCEKKGFFRKRKMPSDYFLY
jgi:hypothetical protein